MRRYYVYIMASESRVLYVGVTNDIWRRVWEHKNDVTPDSSASIASTPCIL
jgi:putative endonuclease